MQNLPKDSRPLRKKRLRKEFNALLAPEKAAYEELVTEWHRRKKEIGPSKPSRAAYEELVTGWHRREKEIYAETRERFEQGEASGKYPVLSTFLSQLLAKDKEEFFRSRGKRALRYPAPPKKPRDSN